MTDTAEPEADAPEVQSGDADKPVWWARHYTFFGTAFGLVFVWFSLTPSLLPRGPLFQGLVSGVAQNATPVGDLVTDFTYPGKLAYTVRVPRYAVKDGSLLYFDLPEMPENWIHAESNTRQRPFLVSTETRSTFTWNVTLPGGLKPVIQPQNYEWTGPANLGTAVFCGGGEAGDDKTCLDFLLDIRLHPALVPTSDYPNLLDLNRHFSHASARRVLLE